MVIGAGAIPAPLLFLGEAPGMTEELFGLPFMGESGQLLTEMKREAAELAQVKIPAHYTSNIVMCRPWDRGDGDNRQPTNEEALACRENVLRVYRAVRPTVVVLLGRVPERYYKREFPLVIALRHPAYLLRLGPHHPERTVQVRLLSEVFADIWHG